MGRAKGSKCSEETKEKMRAAAKRRGMWKEPKICTNCGNVFYRRTDETLAAFVKRQKCLATCIRDSLAEYDVEATYAHPRTTVDGAGDEQTLADIFLSMTWWSQSRHWLRFY